MKQNINIEYTENEFIATVDIANAIIGGMFAIGQRIIDGELSRQERNSRSSELEHAFNQGKSSSTEVQDLKNEIRKLQSEIRVMKVKSGSATSGSSTSFSSFDLDD